MKSTMKPTFKSIDDFMNEIEKLIKGSVNIICLGETLFLNGTLDLHDHEIHLNGTVNDTMPFISCRNEIIKCEIGVYNSSFFESQNETFHLRFETQKGDFQKKIVCPKKVSHKAVLHHLIKDGVILLNASIDECFIQLQRKQSASWAWAIKYEGWNIITAEWSDLGPNMAVNKNVDALIQWTDNTRSLVEKRDRSIAKYWKAIKRKPAPKGNELLIFYHDMDELFKASINDYNRTETDFKISYLFELALEYRSLYYFKMLEMLEEEINFLINKY